MKICKVCQVNKSESEFYKSTRHKDGLFAHCKACHKVKKMAWPSQSNEGHKVYGQKWRVGNRDRIRVENRERQKKWYNKLSQAERSSLYKTHADYLIRYKQSMTDEQILKYRETSKIWKENNPDKVYSKAKRYRARLQNASGSHTMQEWVNLCEQYSNKCLRCGSGDKLTEDHIKPLSKGGSDNIDNIQPLCHRCNSGKCDKEIDYREVSE